MTHRTSAATTAVLLFLTVAPATVRADEDCDTLGYAGRCEGGRVVWCEGGEVHETDCSKDQRACGWDDQNGYYACVAEAAIAAGCPDELTWVGRCDGDARVEWCQDGAVQSLTCTDGTRCDWGSEGFYDCLAGGGAGNAQGAGGGGTSGGEEPARVPEAEPRDPAQPAPEKTPSQGGGASGGGAPTQAGSSQGPETQPTTHDGDTSGAATPPPGDASTQPAFGCTAAPEGAPHLGALAALAALALSLGAWRRARRT